MSQLNSVLTDKMVNLIQDKTVTGRNVWKYTYCHPITHIFATIVYGGGWTQ